MALALVLRGRVGARKAVQTLVQRASVLDVAADRGIRPRLLHVAVEAQMQVDQLADVLDHVVVEMQCLQTLARHLRADGVMTVEAHLAARFETTGLRLADVVQQSRQTQRQVRGRHRTVGTGFEGDGAFDDDHGVFDTSLWRWCSSISSCSAGISGSTMSARPESTNASMPARGRSDSSSLTSSSRTRSAGDDFDAIDHVGQRFGGFRLDAEAELRHETHGAHHAQRIVVERLPRIDGGTQHAFGQIVRTAERIDEFEFRTRNAIALTVKSRRERSPSSVSP